MDSSKDVLKSQVTTLCNSLLKAVEELQSEQPGPSASQASAARSSLSLRPEINNLFNWTKGKGKSKTRMEQDSRSSSKSKKYKIAEWNHTFVCLSKIDANEVPDCIDKAALKLAGLGEKKLSLSMDEADPCVFHQQLLEEYPKLSEAGGYEIMKQRNNSKALELIPTPPLGYSVEYLKSVIANAKLYIRPIQKDLDTSPVDITAGLTEKCFTCGMTIPIYALREHVSECKTKISNDSLYIDDHQEEISYAQLEEPTSHEMESLSLYDVIKELQTNSLSEEYQSIVVRRSHFLEDVLKKCAKPSFIPEKRITVTFVGEDGVDVGGLTREFFSLLPIAVSPKFIDEKGCFSHNSLALQDKIYFHLGQLAAMSFTQGGSGFNVLCSAVYDYIGGKELKEIEMNVEDISDCDVMFVINEITQANSVEELREVCGKHFSPLCDSGFTKPSSSVILADKSNIINMICLHHIILKCKGEIDQFSHGLESLGTLKAIRRHRKLLRQFFVKLEGVKLTAERLRKMFVAHYSSSDDLRDKEEVAFMMLMDYLEEIEEGKNPNGMKLENVLKFFSGHINIPPSDLCITLMFTHTSKYPSTSTCSIELHIPTMYRKFEDFRHAVDFAISNSEEFGNL